MKVRYCLTMEGLVVHGEPIDNVTIDWEEETTEEEVMRLSRKWLMTHNILTSRMNGLLEVELSSLTAEPV